MYKKRSFRGGSPRHTAYSNSNQRHGRRRMAGAQTIQESRFINHNVAHIKEAAAPQAEHAFSDFNFAPQVQENVSAAGFTTPSAIQDKTIPLILAGKDVIGLANTGTGKTAAFLLPILSALNHERLPGSVLIMAPTRELAQQTDDEFHRFSRGMRLFSALLVGGVAIGPQFRNLSRRPQVIIGTPGRIKDHLTRGSLALNNVKFFVLDEADRMLDMGFVNDIRHIASLLPAEKQTLCFSATFSDGIKSIANDFMNEPKLVSVKVTETNAHIYQDVVHYTDAEQRRELLLSMLRKDEFEKVIVFCETKYGAQRLSDVIDRGGISSRAIHGNKSQSQRTRALDDFKAAKAQVLVATDVAARGLDVSDVSHVINFDPPRTYDDYVHRIGRTGRGGKTGTALTFVQTHAH